MVERKAVRSVGWLVVLMVEPTVARWVIVMAVKMAVLLVETMVVEKVVPTVVPMVVYWVDR